jgi:soluble lytic murein transglycosylase-like protein
VDENLLLNASEATSENPTEVKVEPGSLVDPYVERPHWVKRNAVKILLGVICILSFSLLKVLDEYSKEHEVRVRVQTNLSWLAYQHRDVRNERDFYSKLTEDFNYYKFIKTIYEAKDKDFFETISIIYEESKRADVSPWKTLSIAYQESGLNPYAVSQIWRKNYFGELEKVPCSYGLMQIYYDVWKDEKRLTKENIFDKRTNVRVGLEIYKYYFALANGNEYLTLFYYNNGTSTPPEKQNHYYAPAVMNSKFMKLAVNYQPIEINIDKTKGISQ